MDRVGQTFLLVLFHRNGRKETPYPNHAPRTAERPRYPHKHNILATR